MCKESIQLEIIKKSRKIKGPARSLFYRNPGEKHFFLLSLSRQCSLLDSFSSKGITFYGNQLKKVSVRSTIAGVPFVFIRGFAFNF